MNDFLRDLLAETLRNPRAAARRLIDLGLAPPAIWSGFGAAVAASAVLAWLSMAATPVATGGVLAGPVVTPLGLAGIQAASILFLAGLVTIGGRAFGGRGQFFGALTLAVWLEFVLILLQLVQLVVMVVFPFFSVLVGFAGMVLFLWLLTNFTAELHGFRSLPAVFFGIVAGFLLTGIAVVTAFGPEIAQQGF